MHFVYILKSNDHEHWYVGLTKDIERRLAEHNAGKSPHTSKYRNWDLKSYIAFKNRTQAEKFEIYLKTHSGRAFTKKRL